MTAGGGEDGDRRLVDMPNAAADLELDGDPWRFDLSRRTTRAATQVAEFTEMLCVVDPRFDKALPANWMRLPYIFALMDALRCDYVASFIETKHLGSKGKTVRVPATPGEQQIRFWMNEDRTHTMIREYIRGQGVDADPDKGERIDQVTPGTRDRREQERRAGVEPVEYYPFLNTRPPAPDPPAVDPEPDGGFGDDQVAGQAIPGPAGPGMDGFVDPVTGVIGSGSDTAGYSSPWLAGDAGDSFSQASA